MNMIPFRSLQRSPSQRKRLSGFAPGLALPYLGLLGACCGSLHAADQSFPAGGDANPENGVKIVDINNNIIVSGYTVNSGANVVMDANGNAVVLTGTVTIHNGARFTTAVAQTLTNGTIINANDRTYDGKALVIPAGATVTINGRHYFKSLVVAGTLTHDPVGTTMTNALVLYIEDVFQVSGLVDLNGKGFAPGYTWPGTTVGGAGPGMGGSYAGRGCPSTGVNFSHLQPAIFGVLYDPREAGGGGANSAGGGSLRVYASTIDLTATAILRANGVVNAGANGGGGAGGCISLNAETVNFTVGCSVKAIGASGSGGTGSGGGGRLAFVYRNITGASPTNNSNFRAHGGYSPSNYYGDAGTIFVRRLGITPGLFGFTMIIMDGPNAGPGSAAIRLRTAEIEAFHPAHNDEREYMPVYVLHKTTASSAPVPIVLSPTPDPLLTLLANPTSGIDLDSDLDGLPDTMENLLGSNPQSADTDFDGVPDGSDAFPLDPLRSRIPYIPNDTTAPVFTQIGF